MAYHHQSTSQVESASMTITLDDDERDAPLQTDVATLRLKLKKPKSRKKVNWTEETIDNENMDKKKSKCCCIYKKPKLPNASSSSSDDDYDECEHCQGHVEKRKNTSKQNSSSDPSSQSMIAT